MGNYSLVERRIVIPYDAIEEQYLVTGCSNTLDVDVVRLRGKAMIG